MKRQAIAIILVLSLIALTACGSVSPQDTGETGALDELLTEAGTGTDTSVDKESDTEEVTAEASEKRELTISVCLEYRFVNNAVKKFNEIYPDVNITVNRPSADSSLYPQRVDTALNAGTADDLIETDVIGTAKYGSGGMLADLYEIMKNDDSFNSTDYYISAVDSIASGDKLFAFPLTFYYFVVSVNKTISETLTERFGTYDTISAGEILNLYNEFVGGYDYYISNNFNVATAVFLELGSFVDYENKTSDFDNQRFIDLINSAKDAASPVTLDEYGSLLTEPQEDMALSSKLMFKYFSSSRYQYYLPYDEETWFSEPIPITTNSGKIPVFTSKLFSINEKSANKDLAWELIKFMSAHEHSDYFYAYQFPVNKAHFQNKIGEEFFKWPKYFESNYSYHVKGNVQEQLDRGIALMDVNNSRQMESYNYDSNIIFDTLSKFSEGEITAEQAALELQKKVSDYLLQ